MIYDDELMGQLIRFVSSHEVGHTLGLRHNYGSSSTVPVEKLRDKTWVEANGHNPSIMDYALFNEETAAKSISFIRNNRSYVINYNYGMDLVRDYVEDKIKDDPTPENRWKVFGELMSRQVRIEDLAKGKVKGEKQEVGGKDDQ